MKKIVIGLVVIVLCALVSASFVYASTLTTTQAIPKQVDTQSYYDAGFIDGNQTGYSQGYADGYVKGSKTVGYNIRDPTMEEVNAFIASDTVHLNSYIANSYTCWNFAADFANNAFSAGIRCGLVYMTFTDGDGAHEINCFSTIDEGLIFYDAYANKIVSLVVGQLYQPDGFEASGTVEYYAIVW